MEEYFVESKSFIVFCWKLFDCVNFGSVVGVARVLASSSQTSSFIIGILIAL